MKKYLKISLFGFIMWLVPFVVSVPLHSQEGDLLIDVFLFKTIMMLVSSVTSSVLVVLYFKKINSNYLKTSVILGLVWLVISLGLDFLVLIPISDLTVNEYFVQIGLRYLVIPIYTVTIGYLLGAKVKGERGKLA